MDKRNLFWYVTVLIVGIFCFSSLALTQEKQNTEILGQLRDKIIGSIKEEELVESLRK